MQNTFDMLKDAIRMAILLVSRNNCAVTIWKGDDWIIGSEHEEVSGMQYIALVSESGNIYFA